ncbi:MAG: endolytic transglycosylase MltG [Pseudomonadota bacterium]|nr:endolytic transglycosylase MltG [Pseudomonadota bacterium]
MSALFSAVFLWGYFQFKAPGPLKNETLIIIERGSGINSISKILQKAGILERPHVFSIIARVLNIDKKLKAGEYAFAKGVSYEGILNLLQSGKTVIRRITIAEGLRTETVLAILDQTEGLQGIVSSPPKEGSLLPETYHFSFGDSREKIIQRMIDARQRLMRDLWQERELNLPFKSPEEAVILASIVEKETSIPIERSRVAAVFINRMKKGMRLQSDPTVVYSLTKGVIPLGRKLTRADLRTPSAYNTYLIQGLPPGPIANPGRASLYAVLHPAKSTELYFVADGKGGHMFAKSLKEHNLNVLKWRRIQKERK